MPSPQDSTAETGKELTPAADEQASERKLSNLHQFIINKQTQKSELEAQIAEAKAQLKDDPQTTVQRHIRLLHEYNEIKDIAQGLLDLIADARGVRHIDVQREYGVGDRD
ncbi:SWI5/SAE3 family protein [Aspergillus saccharolyticus JOP 1030-1]|uniref:Swi5-domain-containing protein n=1 Tax=Aspergillus saccharolyticus JOP 1030-1 TaxID=1450539 RepID=A0A318Z1N9_9EURO|nr:Swi5-domain-containing protein [Aspergillus saccharolyticus JOP 1030-1]PYH40304.1 Swi5-domain-containing protein [Aspergillus saccharolyticus JOP 1030-1]